MTLRSRLKGLESKEGLGGGQRRWDFSAMITGYILLGRWLIEHNLLLAEAVAQGAKGPPGLPFTLHEALEAHNAAAQPAKPDFDPYALNPWTNPEDYQRCHVEVIRCGSGVWEHECTVMERRKDNAEDRS